MPYQVRVSTKIVGYLSVNDQSVTGVVTRSGAPLLGIETSHAEHDDRQDQSHDQDRSGDDEPPPHERRARTASTCS